MSMKALFAFLFISTLFSLTVQAQPVSLLEETILRAQQNCPQLDCDNSPVRVKKLTQQEFKDLGAETRKALRTLVVNLARDLWPDTILEGSYEHANRFRVDLVQKLLLDGKQVGFRVSYSDKAWNTDTCQYDPRNPDSLKDCEQGRIRESAFVDQKLSRAFRDLTDLAEYYSDKD